ncbi:hypothetical protein ACFL6W_07815 [Thermodesulfobacteriota bacterium]
MDRKIKFENFFSSIDPPKGGVHGLREKMDKLEGKNCFFSFPKIALATTIAVAVLAAIVIIPGLLKPESNLFMELVKKSENPSFIKYGYLKRSSEAVSIPAKARSHLAVMRVKTENENIKFYIIESLDETVPGQEETM